MGQYTDSAVCMCPAICMCLLLHCISVYSILSCPGVDLCPVGICLNLILTDVLDSPSLQHLTIHLGPSRLCSY